MNVKGNGVFWAKPEDSIANNLYKVVREKKSALPGMLEGVGQNPSVRPKKTGNIWDAAKHLAGGAWDAIGGWSGVAAGAASLLLDPVDPKSIGQYVVKSNYMDSLRKA